jgi:tripartite-type tricarboxylate transporter receptor subunit TctC
MTKHRHAASVFAIPRPWISIALVVAAFSAPAVADPIAEFYRGRTIEIDVGAAVGGGYDATARLVARHLARFIPGNPAIIVADLPGGGGIRVANVLFNKSPRDGSVLGTFSNAMITEPLLGGDRALFDPARFTWIGSASREDGLCMANRASGVTTWADLLQKELVVGTTAPGTTTYMYPVMLHNLFGARFKLISGYSDSKQIALAVERGEVQAICQTYSSVKIEHENWLRDRIMQPLIALSFDRIPDLPDLPAVMEFAKDDEQRQVLKVVLTPTLAGRPFVGPPDIPGERAAALRAAFGAMTRDADFVNDARRLGTDVQPATGDDISALVKEIYSLPKGVIEMTERVVTSREARK